MKLGTSLPRSICALFALALFLTALSPIAASGGDRIERLPPPGFTGINGDVNADRRVDLADIVYLLEWSFSGGPDPAPFYCRYPLVLNGDANGDGARDITDVVYLLAWKFGGGPDPVASCGTGRDDPGRTILVDWAEADEADAVDQAEADAADPVIVEHVAVARKSVARRIAGTEYEMQPVSPMAPILPEVRILDLNISGVALQNGQDISEYILYKVGQLDANVVTLQEICSTQASGILAVLPGWSMFFKKNTTDEGCGGSQTFGLATFVKGEISDPEWWELPYSNPEFGWSKYLTKIRWRATTSTTLTSGPSAATSSGTRRSSSSWWTSFRGRWCSPETSTPRTARFPGSRRSTPTRSARSRSGRSTTCSRPERRSGAMLRTASATIAS